MAITGLKLPVKAASATSVASLLKAGKPNVSSAVNATVKLLSLLNLVGDEASLRSSLLADYTRLADLGYDGRLYPELPEHVTFDQLLQVVEGKRLENVPEASVWAPFWVPGTEAGSVTGADLNGSAVTVSARLALFSSDAGGLDPVLHFRGLSFDDTYRESGRSTQLEELQKAEAGFIQAHAGTTLRAADHRDFLVWALMDRLSRRKPTSDAFVLNAGWMRVSALGRRSVVGVSVVGEVHSALGRLGFVGGRGGPRFDFGVGLSAGFEEA